MWDSLRVLALAVCLLFLTGLAQAQGLPSELPVPAGVTITGNVQHSEYAQDDFPRPGLKGSPAIAGHFWKGFFKGQAGDPKVTVAAWKSTLSGAGWEVLDSRVDQLVARKGLWWVKVGLDRLSLVQQVEAAAFDLQPPGEQPEELVRDQDVPYAAPLPGSTRKQWKPEAHLEFTNAKDGQMVVLGPAISILYLGPQQLSVLEVQTRYKSALQKAGWAIVRSDTGGLTAAHYTQHGRDVWLKITPTSSNYTIEVADLGAAAAHDKLAKALDDAGHVALYGIYFDTDKATLRPDSEPTLLQIQKLLASNPRLKLEIQGHTDSTGTRPHNQKLSGDRAASVKAWLVAHGIDGARLTTNGYADTKPVADNAMPEGRALNRRVELARM
jgi:outer membrane protein OmpA-like peptidoglycan-associated protein